MTYEVADSFPGLKLILELSLHAADIGFQPYREIILRQSSCSERKYSPSSIFLSHSSPGTECRSGVNQLSLPKAITKYCTGVVPTFRQPCSSFEAT